MATNEPANPLQSAALANHWRAGDPHSQYLLKVGAVSYLASLGIGPGTRIEAADAVPASLILGGGGATGSSAKYARADHVHPVPAMPVVPPVPVTDLPSAYRRTWMRL